MSRIEKSIEVAVPVRTAYNQWTRFEEFPKFMEGVKEVRRLGDTRLHWRVQIAGVEREWDAQIVEQLPDQRIVWRSLSRERNDGTVTFQRIGVDRTQITLSINYQPEGVVEVTGDTLGVVSGRVEGDLRRFKEFIESRGRETGAWRGKIHGGRTMG